MCQSFHRFSQLSQPRSFRTSDSGSINHCEFLFIENVLDSFIEMLDHSKEHDELFRVVVDCWWIPALVVINLRTKTARKNVIQKQHPLTDR